MKKSAPMIFPFPTVFTVSKLPTGTGKPGLRFLKQRQLRSGW